MTQLLLLIKSKFEFVNSPLFIIIFLLLINRGKNKIIYLFVTIIIFILLGLNPEFIKWHERLLSPVFGALLIIVIPALYLKNTKYYKWFLIIPYLAVIWMISEIVHNYLWLPKQNIFYWFLISPGILISGISGLLIILKDYVDLINFRKITRIIFLIILLYGGFAFRKNYLDYDAMLSRRSNYQEKVLNLSETVPVMKGDNTLYYIPSAPCRFSADGGYVQGCVMELLQRFFQIDFYKIINNEASEIALLSIILGSMLTIIVLLFIGSRFWCGWICPLSTIGDIFNLIRKTLRLPHFKISLKLKRFSFISGISFGSICLILAKMYANIDENGKFLGCKIPLYPFCKICPGQQVCPVASQGINYYAGIPSLEWLFGFFKISTIFLLGFFIFGFISSRRLWCRLCPMGLIGGIFNSGGMLALTKNSLKCNGCGVCNEVCPADIHFVQHEMNKTDVSNFNCVYCLNCVALCPKAGCLGINFNGKKII